MTKAPIYYEPMPWDGENRTPEGYSEYLLRDAVRACVEEGRSNADIMQAVADELKRLEQSE